MPDLESHRIGNREIVGTQPLRTVRTIVVFMENMPGTLSRMAALFRRRSYDILSFTMGRTEDPMISRVTLVVDADARTARLLQANLYKLVNVIQVNDVTHDSVVSRELALIKVVATRDTTSQITSICNRFDARVAETSDGALIVEVASTEKQLEVLVAELDRFGIIELVRTGGVALSSGNEPSCTTSRATPISANKLSPF